MVAEGYKTSQLALRKILETEDTTPIPELTTTLIPRKPTARDLITPPVYDLPCGIEIKGVSGVNFAIEVENFDEVDVQQWYLYKTEDGNKWFKGEIETTITDSTIFQITNASAVGFYAQITRVEGAGIIRCYASGNTVE